MGEELIDLGDRRVGRLLDLVGELLLVVEADPAVLLFLPKIPTVPPASAIPSMKDLPMLPVAPVTTITFPSNVNAWSISCRCCATNPADVYQNVVLRNLE